MVVLESGYASGTGFAAPQGLVDSDIAAGVERIYTAPSDLPVDARGEASMLSTRSFRALTNIELDPKLADRGVGRTPLIPKEKQLPPGRIHLAAGGAFNPTEAASESLQAVLEALGDAAHAGMLEKKALPDGWTPLMHAVRSGKLSDVEALLALGADVMTRDRESRTRARPPPHRTHHQHAFCPFALLPFCP